MVAMVVKGGSVIAIGKNFYKKPGKTASHIISNEINPELKDLYDNRSVHAELHALVQLLKSDNSKGRVTLVVSGTADKNHRDINTTKPCPVCQTLIEESGIVDTVIFKENNEIRKVRIK